MFERLRRLRRIATPGSAHYECRHCGTTVETPQAACPACDSAEIARYSI